MDGALINLIKNLYLHLQASGMNRLANENWVLRRVGASWFTTSPNNHVLWRDEDGNALQLLAFSLEHQILEKMMYHRSVCCCNYILIYIFKTEGQRM